MNWDQMKKNLHTRVQLVPIPHRLDEHGGKLPSIEDDWLIEEITSDTVRIKNLRTRHTTSLGKDHIYDWRSNPDRSQAGAKYGFFVLKVQILLKPKGIAIIPNARPGEPVEPPKVEVVSDFDNFMDERTQKKSDAEKLASRTATEWIRMKEIVADFARSGKRADGHLFQWFADGGAELFVLNYSSATFLAPTLTMRPKFRICIDRKPPGPGKMYVEDKSPVPSTRWNLEVEVQRGEFLWTIRETGWRGSTEELAIQIAKALVTHYDEYKRRFPQAV
jgi:hypothetical protein